MTADEGRDLCFVDLVVASNEFEEEVLRGAGKVASKLPLATIESG